MALLVALLALVLHLAPATSSPEYEQACMELSAALDAANEDPEAGLDRLTLALEELARHPEPLIDDPAMLEQRSAATLALARSHASAGHDQLASDIMDRALRESGGSELLVERFGPRTRELAEQRRAALTEAGQGSVEVDCRVDCRVYVDEREVSNPTPPLWLGPRRIVVRAVGGELASKSWVVDLVEPERVRLVYGEVEAVIVEPKTTVEPTRRPRKDRGPAPLLASGGTLLAGGVALTAFGIGWWARGVEVDITRLTARVDDYRPSGAALTGVGIVSLAIGATLMSLETLRTRKARERSRIGFDVTPRYFGLSVAGQF